MVPFPHKMKNVTGYDIEHQTLVLSNTKKVVTGYGYDLALVTIFTVTTPERLRFVGIFVTRMSTRRKAETQLSPSAKRVPEPDEELIVVSELHHCQ